MKATPAAARPHPPPARRAVDADESAYECIGICLADPTTGLCEGCGRPLAEPQSQWAEDCATTRSPPSSASATT